MANDNSGNKKTLMTTAIVVLLLTLMGAGVGFAVGVFLKPGVDSQETAGRQQPDQAGEATGKPGETHGTKSEDEHSGSEEAPEDHGAMSSADEGEDGAPAEEPSPENLAVVPFPPVLTALRKPESKWIRLEGALLVKPDSEVPQEQLSAQASEQMLAYLKTVELSQIEGPSGFLALRYDLTETVKRLSGGNVHGLFIYGLVVE